MTSGKRGGVAIEYLNFDLEIRPRSRDVYPVAARSEAGEAHHPMRFPLEGLALDNVLLRVQNALLRAGNVRRGNSTPEEQIVQSFGRTLFETLLAEGVRRLYDASAALASQQGKGLRLRLRIQAPELAALPWEFLYDPLQGEYLCFLPDVALVRYLETAQPIPPFKVELPLRVLAMLADPSDQGRLDIMRERQRLIEAMHPLEQRGLVKLRWVEGQTVQALYQALLQRDWHIFHYIGHGGFDSSTQEGVLALVNEQGMTQRLRATDLGRMLTQRPSLRLVVLNACQGATGSKQNLFSSTAATLASKRIPAVLAMQYDITDQAAVGFTQGFYEALAVGIPVDGAVTQARTAMSVGRPRTLEWVTPVLYMRAADGTLFDLPPLSQTASGQMLLESDLLGPTKHCPRCNDLLPASARFCGRCGLRFPSLLEPQSKGESPPPAPAKTSALQKNKLLLAIGALVLLAALAGSGGAALWSRIHQAPPTARTTPTNTAQSHYPNAPSGTLVLNDPLSQPFHWENFSNAAGACQFSNAAYHVRVVRSDTLFDCLAQGAGADFSNFTFEVQMQMVTGDCGGIVFRANDANSNHYDFIVCRDGTYSLVVFQDGIILHTVKAGASSAVQTAPNQFNTLAIVANGNMLELYVNKQKITTASDHIYSHGDIGVLAEDITHPAEVVYSNAKVWVDNGS